ncbi:bis(5'-nucleosyl)-tetraphosphatase PrpE [asymmetrical]-like [Clavelina lepadiformis]|uniref:bis(5'-nucleosyl)-tetraphosphatase PrpE [asymmetrical]-like n=1 Tax=Clavelina lepadiformis TaxID=159417 RepID=UPI004043334E
MLPVLLSKRAGMAGFLGFAASYISSYFHFSTKNEQLRLQDETEPFIRHKTLLESDFQGKDLVIVGDVHGCYDELMKLFEEVKKKTFKSFVTVFVGDMINKGPKNLEVLNYIINTPHIHCIRGNHEQKVVLDYLKFMKNNVEPKPPMQWVKELSGTQANFLKNLPYTISIPSLNLVVVHAGLEPGKSLQLHNANDMANMRNLVSVKDEFHGKVLKPTSIPGVGTPWVELWPGPEHVYFGHDAVKKLQLNENSTGLDTGCVYGGKLTCVLLHLNDKSEKIVEKELISVEPVNVYVPVD